DEPTTLPEGTVIDLVADDDGDDLTDDERQALHEALSASWNAAEAGHVRPAAAILEELRQRRGACRFGPHANQIDKAEKSTTGGAQTDRQHPTCSYTNSRRRSRSSVTRRTSDARIVGRPSQPPVDSCWQHVVITSTTSHKRAT